MGFFQIAEDCWYFANRRSVGKHKRRDDAARVDPRIGFGKLLLGIEVYRDERYANSLLSQKDPDPA